MAQWLPPKSMVYSCSWALLIWIFLKGPKIWVYHGFMDHPSFAFWIFLFKIFFIIFFFKNFSLFFFFGWKFHFLKKLFTKDVFLWKLFFFAKNFFFFFWSSPLARTHCSLPLKVHEILIFLGLGKQQRGPRLGSFILGFEGCWVFSP